MCLALIVLDGYVTLPYRPPYLQSRIEARDDTTCFLHYYQVKKLKEDQTDVKSCFSRYSCHKILKIYGGLRGRVGYLPKHLRQGSYAIQSLNRFNGFWS